MRVLYFFLFLGCVSIPSANTNDFAGNDCVSKIGDVKLQTNGVEIDNARYKKMEFNHFEKYKAAIDIDEIFVAGEFFTPNELLSYNLDESKYNYVIGTCVFSELHEFNDENYSHLLSKTNFSGVYFESQHFLATLSVTLTHNSVEAFYIPIIVSSDHPIFLHYTSANYAG